MSSEVVNKNSLQRRIPYKFSVPAIRSPRSEQELMEIKIKIPKVNQRTPSTTVYSLAPSDRFFGDSNAFAKINENDSINCHIPHIKENDYSLQPTQQRKKSLDSANTQRILSNYNRGLSCPITITHINNDVIPSDSKNPHTFPAFKDLNTNQKSILIASIVDQIERLEGGGMLGNRLRGKKSCVFYKRPTQVEMRTLRAKSTIGIEKLNLSSIDEETLQKRKAPKSKKSMVKNVHKSIFGFTSSLLKHDSNMSIHNFRQTIQTSKDDMLHARLIKDIEAQLQEDNIPVMKSAVALNNFLIRDFKIGEEAEGVKSSRKKTKISNYFFGVRAEKQKRIAEMRNEQTKKLINDEIDEALEPEFMSDPLKSPVKIQRSSYGNDELKQIKSNFNSNKKKKGIEKGKKLADLLLDIDCKEYTTVDGASSQDPIQRSDINRVNLQRSIRLHNIMSKRVDAEGDELAVEDIEKFKRMKQDNDIDLIKTLKRLGPPNFLKNKFKGSTLMKYRAVNGKFFGVLC